MKKIFLAAFFIGSFLFTSAAEALVSVKGYYRSNGTYVAPHYRTSPDSSTSNNFSTNGYKTTGVSRATAQSWENSLNRRTYQTPTYSAYFYTAGLSKREKKVVNCQNQGNTEQYCKSVYMKSKK